MKTEHATVKATAHAASSSAASGTGRAARAGQPQDLFAQLLQSGLSADGEESGTAVDMSLATDTPGDGTAHGDSTDLLTADAAEYADASATVAQWLPWMTLPANANAHAAVAPGRDTLPEGLQHAAATLAGQDWAGHADVNGRGRANGFAGHPVLDGLASSSAQADHTDGPDAPIPLDPDLVTDTSAAIAPGALATAGEGTSVTDTLAASAEATLDDTRLTATPQASSTAPEAAAPHLDPNTVATSASTRTTEVETTAATQDAQADATSAETAATAPTQTTAAASSAPQTAGKAHARHSPGRIEPQGPHWSRAADANGTNASMAAPSTQQLADAVARAWHMSTPGQPGSALSEPLAAAPTWGASISALASGAADGQGRNGDPSQPGSESAALLGAELGTSDNTVTTTSEAGGFAMSLGEALGDAFETLGGQVSFWAASQTKRASLKLDLGLDDPLEVDVSLDADKAQLNFRSDDPQVREALKTQAPAALSELLARAGLSLESFSVGSQASGQSAGQPGEGRPTPWRNLRVDANATAAPATLRPTSANGRAGLDLYA